MHLCTINYKGTIENFSSHWKNGFSTQSPIQRTLRTSCFTIVMFKNSKCRIMGVKFPLTQIDLDRMLLKCQLPIKIRLGPLQSSTWSISLFDDGTGSLSLNKIAMHLGSHRAMYEPEIFPALRLLDFNPLCVNVFHSGKCVILGHKSTEAPCDIVLKIRNIIAI